ELAETLLNAPSGSGDLKQAIRANIVAWAPRASRLKVILPHPGREAVDADYSPDGETIITLSLRQRSGTPIWSGRARLWCGDTGEPLVGPVSKRADVLVARFSPDSQSLATCNDDGMVRLWRVSDGAPLVGPLRHGGAVLCVAFSTDGRTLLTGGTDGT